MKNILKNLIICYSLIFFYDLCFMFYVLCFIFYAMYLPLFKTQGYNHCHRPYLEPLY